MTEIDRLNALLRDAHAGVDRLQAENKRLRIEEAAYHTAAVELAGGKLTATRAEDGTLVALTLTDDEHRVERVLWARESSFTDEQVQRMREHGENNPEVYGSLAAKDKP